MNSPLKEQKSLMGKPSLQRQEHQVYLEYHFPEFSKLLPLFPQSNFQDVRNGNHVYLFLGK